MSETPHYYQLPNGLQPWDIFVDCSTPEEIQGACKLNTLKYILRAGSKPNNPTEQDLEKALWYLEKWIELVSK